MVFKKSNKNVQTKKTTKKVQAKQTRLRDLQNNQTDYAQMPSTSHIPMQDTLDSNGNSIPPQSLAAENKTNDSTSLQCFEKISMDRSSLNSIAKTDTSDLVLNTSSTEESMPIINRPTTPNNVVPPEEVFSPNTISEIRSTIRTLFPNGPPKPPPVIPVKRNKKGETPYIVGCTQRKRVPENKSLKFFIGDDYGITPDTNAFDNEDAPLHTHKKRSRISYNGKISKSRFNPQSDEIAARLKINDRVDELLRKPQIETKSFMDKPYSTRPSAFSPIPSTSKDSETIMKNENNFNDSLYLSMDNNNGNFEMSDDEELPVVIMTSKGKPKKKKKHISLLQNENLNTINLPSTTAIKDIVGQINSETFLKEIDFDAIFFNKKSPKSEDFTIPNRSISPIVNDDIIDNEIIIEDESKPDNASIKNYINEIKDENSPLSTITYEDMYGIPQAEFIDDEDDVLAEFEAYKKKKAENSTNSANIITIVDPITLEATKNEIKPTEGKLKAKKRNTVDLVTPHAALSVSKGDNVCETELSSSTTNNNLGDFVSSHQAVTEAKSNAVCKRSRKVCNNVPSAAPPVIEIPDYPESAENVSVQNNNNTPSHWWSDDVEIVSETDNVRPFNTSSNNEVEIVEGNISSCPRINRKRRSEELVNGLHTFLSIVDQNLSNLWGAPNKRRKRTAKETQTQKTPTKTQCENEAPSNSADFGLGDCPICLEKVSRSSVASTTCGHVFCLGCLKQSLKSSGKRCPTCRKVLKGTGYHQLYL